MSLYELSNNDIDIISFALKNRINYLEGLLLIQERFKKEDEEQIAVLKTMLRETKRVQDLTSYNGQSVFFK